MAKYVTNAAAAARAMRATFIRNSLLRQAGVASVHPFCDEKVHFVAVGLGAAARPHDVFPIGTEDTEAVEARRGRDALEVLPVLADQPEVEVEALRVHVRGEEDALAVRQIGRDH